MTGDQLSALLPGSVLGAATPANENGNVAAADAQQEETDQTPAVPDPLVEPEVVLEAANDNPLPKELPTTVHYESSSQPLRRQLGVVAG